MSEELLRAVKKDDLILTKSLLNQGADIHYRGDEAICLAVAHGFFNTTQYLLTRGADVNSNNNFPLRTASKNGDYYIVSLLLDKGADIHADDEESLYNAIEGDHCKVVELLIYNGADIHNSDDLPLRSAVGHNRLNCVKLLLDNGADIHTNDDLPLHVALYDGNYEMVRMLFSYGADIKNVLDNSSTIKEYYDNYLEWDKENPEEGEFISFEPEVVEPEVKSEVKPEVKSISKREYKLEEGLIKAVTSGNLIDVIELLAHGADIHYKNDLALQLAAKLGNRYIFSYLLQNGADKSILDSSLSLELKQIIDTPHLAKRYYNMIKKAISKRELKNYGNI